MRCPVCNVMLENSPGHWGHGYDDCSVRVYVSREDARDDLLPWGVKRVLLKEKKYPLVVNRTLTLLLATAPSDLRSKIKESVFGWSEFGWDEL